MNEAEQVLQDLAVSRRLRDAAIVEVFGENGLLIEKARLTVLLASTHMVRRWTGEFLLRGLETLAGLPPNTTVHLPILVNRQAWDATQP